MKKIIQFLGVLLVLCCLAAPAQSQTFLTTYGNSGVNDGASSITPAPGGNYFVAGYHGTNAVLMEMTPAGATVWTREFNFTVNSDQIYDLILDSDGFLVGCGSGTINGSNAVAFAFRYDYINDLMDWTSVEQGGHHSRHYSVIEKPGANANYILVGTNTTGQRNGHIVELDRNSGAIANTSTNYFNTIGTDRSDDFSSSIIIGNDLFMAGRSILSGASSGSINRSRGVMGRFDVDGAGFGNEIWNRYYLEDLSTNAREYHNDIISVGNNLVACGFGDPTGVTANFQLFITEADQNGILIPNRCRRININGYSSEIAREIVRISNGYIVLGQANNGGADDLFLMRLDNNFGTVWVHSFGDTGDDDFFANANAQLVVDEVNDAIYFVGQSTSYGSGDVDMLIGRANLNGEITNNGTVCHTVRTATNVLIADEQGAYTFANPASPGFALNFPTTVTPLLVLGNSSACGSGGGPVLCDTDANFTFANNNCTFQFTDMSTVGVGTSIVGWLWNFGDGTTSTETNPIHIFPAAGQYDVCLTVFGLTDDGLCCTSELCIKGFEVNCTPDPCSIMPTFDWTTCGDDCTVMFNGGYSFSNRHIGAWSWDFGDGTTGTGQNIQHQFPGTGSYTVTLTVIGITGEGECCVESVDFVVNVDCERGSGAGRMETPNSNNSITHDSYEDYVDENGGSDDQATSVRTIKDKNELAVYPNPNNGSFNLLLPMSGAHNVTVMNTMGQVVWQQDNATGNKLNVNLASQPNGIYLVRVDGPEGIQTIPVMKK